MQSVLAVTMIVKNESEHLRSCLEALKPLTEKPWCSLYITDTGSEDDTLSAASEYNANILHFKWNSNFADARNHALEKISAQWIMFLDADEYLKNAGAVADFFESGKYRSFGCASFVIRNLADGSGRVYTEQAVPRLFRFDKNVRFTGAVHEHIENVHMPMALIDGAYAEHQGYRRDNGSARRHAERNILLLEKAAAEQTDNVMLYCQLSDAYAMTEDYGRAEKYARIGAGIDTDDVGAALSVRSKLAAVLYAQGKYEDCRISAEEYYSFRKGIDIPAPDGEVYYYHGMSLWGMKSSGTSAVLDKYFEYLDKFKAEPEKYFSASFESGCCDKLSVRRASEALFGAAMLSGDHEKACSALSRTVPSRWANVREYIIHRLDMTIELFEKSGGKYSSQFAETAAIAAKKYPGELFCAVIKSDKRDILSGMISEGFSAALNGEHCLSENWASDKIYGCMSVYYGLKNGRFSGIIYDKESLSAILHNVKDMPRIMGDFEGEASAADSYNLYRLYGEAVSDKLYSGEETVSALKKAVKYGMKYFRAVYAAGLIEENSLLLPSEVRGIAAFEAAFAVSAGSREFAAKLREGVSLLPEYAPAVRVITEKMSAPRPMTEMERLAMQIKASAAAMIKAGKLSQAAETLKSYLSMFPNDSEAVKMLEKTGSKCKGALRK